MRFTLVTLLIACFSATSLVQAEENNVNLRRRNNNDGFKSANDGEEEEQRVWVKYRKNKRADFQTALQKRSSRTRMHYDFKELDAFVVSVPKEDVKALRRDPSVESVHVDQKRYPMYIPESVKKVDSRKLQDNVEDGEQTIPYGIDMVKAPEAWEMGATGANVKVCVVDTGVSNHPDLVDVVGPDTPLPFTQDGVGHGTHCAGTIAAANNSFGVVGVAPDAEIISVKVFSDDGTYAYSSGILSAAEKCADLGANIVSMSLGGPLPNIFEIIGYRSLMSRGVISVAAAGNFGNGLWSFPASYPGVVSVAAVDENKEKASFSQFNRQLDIAAPGVDVLSTLPQEADGKCDICDSIGSYTYGTISGTSMACPHVAGVLALLRSKYVATPEEYIAAIEKSAEDLGQSGKDKRFGHGLIQADGALTYLENQGASLVTSPPTTMSPAPAPTKVPVPSPMTEETSSSISTPLIFNGNTPENDNKAMSCDDDEYLFELKLLTDDNGSETSWDLSAQVDDGMQLTGTGYPNNEAIRIKTCIPKNCYIFTIKDEGKDGICCSHGKGAYSLFVDDDILVNGGGDFDSEDMMTFGCDE